MIRVPIETPENHSAFSPISAVYLESSHLCIRAEIAQRIFGDDPVVLTVFYGADNSFLVSPASDELFRKLHKGSQQILKKKNAAGDRAVLISDVLLDNDLNAGNRDLAFVAEDALHILKVKL